MRKALPEVMGHWSKLLEGMEASPMEFYAAVEAAIERREIPEATTVRIEWPEGGVMGAKREYLRVQRHEHVMDICGAPFGRGFFVSWWLGREQSPYGLLALIALLATTVLLIWIFGEIFGTFAGFLLALLALPVLLWFFVRYLADQLPMWDDALAAMPVFGFIYRRWIRPFTYYRVDTAQMFRTAVDAAVQEVVDEMVEAQGLRALTAAERKPVMRGFLEPTG